MRTAPLPSLWPSSSSPPRRQRPRKATRSSRNASTSTTGSNPREFRPQLHGPAPTGRDSDQNAPLVLYARGEALREQSDFAGAIADYSAALARGEPLLARPDLDAELRPALREAMISPAIAAASLIPVCAIIRGRRSTTRGAAADAGRAQFRQFLMLEPGPGERASRRGAGGLRRLAPGSAEPSADVLHSRGPGRPQAGPLPGCRRSGRYAAQVRRRLCRHRRASHLKPGERAQLSLWARSVAALRLGRTAEGRAEHRARARGARCLASCRHPISPAIHAITP